MLFQTGPDVNSPLIVRNEEPSNNEASSGIGSAIKAAKYQKNN